MASMPLALSVHSFISSVGADAGFAAIVGLAILVLLYFAHARETANLREEAAMLTQRLQQAEARVAQLSRAQAAAQPAANAQGAPSGQVVYPAPASFRAVAGAGTIPAAPAGMGAPALAAATRVVPSARVAPQPAVAAQSREPAVAAQASQPAVAAPPPPPAFAAQASQSAAPAAATRTPASVSPELETGDGQFVGAPAPATVAGGNGSAHPPVVAAPVGAGQTAPQPGIQPRPGGGPAGRRQPPPPRGPVPRESSLGRRVLLLLVGALGLAAVVGALLIATSSGGTSQTSTSAGRTTNAAAAGGTSSARPFAPSSVIVAVLNGTSTNQLAHTVAAKLAAEGYKEGTVATAANQTETATVVAYLPGAKNRTAALHVATALKLGPASVQPVDSSTQQVACPPPSACTANVVVTVGADLATL